MSEAALTDSTTPASSPASSAVPVSGNSTKTTSPSACCACSVIPTVTLPSSSSRAHSWLAAYFSSLGVRLIKSPLGIGFAGNRHTATAPHSNRQRMKNNCQHAPVSAQTHRVSHNLALHRVQRINAAHTRVAQPAQAWRTLRKQTLEALHGRHHHKVVALALALVAAQQRQLARGQSERETTCNFLRQYSHVRQAQVHSLARQRVYGVGGVGHQCNARLHIVHRVPLAQGEGEALGGS